MGWFKNLTKFVAKVDRALSPQHKFVQDKITAQVFHGNDQAALNTAHGLGVGVLDFFYPGLGSALNATDQYQDGNYKGGNLSLVSAGFQSWASGSYSGSTPNTAPTSTPAGYDATTLGTGLKSTSGYTGAGFDASTGAGISGSLNTSATFVSSADYANAFNTLDNSVVGFTSEDLGAGITASDAQAVGAKNLTVRDVRQGINYKKAIAGAGVKLYDLVTRDGQTLATFGNNQMPELPRSSINYQFSAPNFISAIPSNAADDARGMALAAMNSEHANNRRNALVLIACVSLLYFGVIK